MTFKIIILIPQVLAGEKEKYTVYKLKLSTPGSVRIFSTSSPTCHPLIRTDDNIVLLMMTMLRRSQVVGLSTDVTPTS